MPFPTHTPARRWVAGLLVSGLAPLPLITEHALGSPASGPGLWPLACGVLAAATAYLLYRLNADTAPVSRPGSQLAASVFNNSQEAIVVTDAAARILDVNPAFERLTGYRRSEVLGRNPRLLSSGRHDRAFYRQFWHSLHKTGQWTGEIWNRRKDGSIFPEWQNVTAIRDAAGRTTHYLASFSDLTERKESEKRLRQMAEIDPLTRLPNRHLLQDRARQAIAEARRQGHAVALLFLDLDRFKGVNDSLGHSVGDRLLAAVAGRLQEAVRDTDTVSRIGGDEFVILLPRIEQAADAGRTAEKLIRAIREPLTLDTHLIDLTTSIGIALYPEDGTDVATLMKHADTAMYHAKEQGRANYQYFTPDMNQRAQARFQLEKALRQALSDDQFVLHYQPQVSLRDGCIVGCEALIRWQHPERGLLPPGEFITVAEECGLIEEIGNWVLLEACRQSARWRAEGLPPVRVGVNVSPSQLRNRNFADTVLATLALTDTPAGLIELEITENLLVGQTPALLATLQTLAEMGIRLALDDFGTGYSNLAYLKQLPIHRLKIDRSFVSDIPHDALDATLTTAIAGLADNFGLGVIAEGVETLAQQEFLLTLGCDEAQGYYFHRPLPAGRFAEVIAADGR